MKREELFKMLEQVSRYPAFQILVITATRRFTVEEEGKLIKATKDGAILLTKRGAILADTRRVGKKWFPLWGGRELTDEELTENEGELIAAINAMK